MRHRFLLCLLLPLNVMAAGEKPDPMAPNTDVPGLPRVLLIGDSISIGYTLPTRELLAGVANVHRIPMNGGSTRDGLKHLDQWLGDGPWDVIHFNWGLHDLKHWKDGKMDITGPEVTPVELYEINLRKLVARLEQTGAKLIFATTTPVPVDAFGRLPGSQAAYNETALKIMREAHVPIDDLEAAAREDLMAIQKSKDVHFTTKGSRRLAEKVAASIKTALARQE
ncbi:MAG: SGNH/GDSL hydrolase family protein [Chthoniobacteraceae bacterium]